RGIYPAHTDNDWQTHRLISHYMDWCELAEFIAVLRAHANLDLLQAELPLIKLGIEIRPLTKNPCPPLAVVTRRCNGSGP
ncbi:MAG: hypothetical protein P8Q31_02600, partial [Luminiphilus sp.]|nr:hypothetical protein [Luminiphilus sp.]MDG1460386.1 hypothetical protein [Luminiphilus sp.]